MKNYKLITIMLHLAFTCKYDRTMVDFIILVSHVHVVYNWKLFNAGSQNKSVIILSESPFLY